MRRLAMNRSRRLGAAVGLVLVCIGAAGCVSPSLEGEGNASRPPAQSLASMAAGPYLTLDAERTGLANVADDGRYTYLAFASEAPAALRLYDANGAPLDGFVRQGRIVAIDGLQPDGILVRVPAEGGAATANSFIAPAPRGRAGDRPPLDHDPEVVEARSRLENLTIQAPAFRRALERADAQQPTAPRSGADGWPSTTGFGWRPAPLAGAAAGTGASPGPGRGPVPSAVPGPASGQRSGNGAGPGNGSGPALPGAQGPGIVTGTNGGGFGALPPDRSPALIGERYAAARQAATPPFPMDPVHEQTARGPLVRVFFASGGRAIVRPDDGLARLEAEALDAVAIQVIGYTDAVGAEGANSDLARARAEAIRTLLIQRGVEPARITVGWHGSGHYLADNETEQGRALNRRVEVLFVQPGTGGRDRERFSAR